MVAIHLVHHIILAGAKGQIMALLAAMNDLDLDGWLRGLFSAGISGGASAITGGFVVGSLDPEHYNFAAGKFYILIGSLFLANAVVSMAKFLQGQPLPGVKQIEHTIQSTTPPARKGAPEVVETIKETRTEPMVAIVSAGDEKAK